MLTNALTTNVAVVNAALAKIGIGPIVSLSEDDDRARAAAQVYETTVRAALVAARWRFNMATAVLVRFVAEPPEEWSAQYAAPPDALEVHRLAIRDVPIRFDRFGDFLLCNALPEDTVVATYSWRCPEQDWTAGFTDYATDLLAAALAPALTRDARLAAVFNEIAEAKRARHASRSAQNRVPERLDTMAFVAARRR